VLLIDGSQEKRRRKVTRVDQDNSDPGEVSTTPMLVERKDPLAAESEAVNRLRAQETLRGKIETHPNRNVMSNLIRILNNWLNENLDVSKSLFTE